MLESLSRSTAYFPVPGTSISIFLEECIASPAVSDYFYTKIVK